MENIKIVDFNSSIKDGQMNTAASFYTEGISVEARREIMNLNKERLVEKFGLTYKNIFMQVLAIRLIDVLSSVNIRIMINPIAITKTTPIFA